MNNDGRTRRRFLQDMGKAAGAVVLGGVLSNAGCVPLPDDLRQKVKAAIDTIPDDLTLIEGIIKRADLLFDGTGEKVTDNEALIRDLQESKADLDDCWENDRIMMISGDRDAAGESYATNLITVDPDYLYGYNDAEVLMHESCHFKHKAHSQEVRQKVNQAEDSDFTPLFMFKFSTDHNDYPFFTQILVIPYYIRYIENDFMQRMKDKALQNIDQYDWDPEQAANLFAKCYEDDTWSKQVTDRLLESSSDFAEMLDLIGVNIEGLQEAFLESEVATKLKEQAEEMIEEIKFHENEEEHVERKLETGKLR